MPAADLVLFDLDGTLTDSAPGILNSLTYALDAMGVERPAPEVMRTFLGPPLAVTFRDSLGMSDAEVEVAIAKYRERYHDVGLFENDVYDGIPGLLASLAAANVPMAVATSKPTYSATRILEHFDLADWFTFIGGADLEGTRGDKASVIAHTLEEVAVLGLRHDPERTVMVGDRHHDVHGATAHGIDTVGVLWGYGSPDELTAAGAVALVETPQELGAALLS